VKTHSILKKEDIGKQYCLIIIFTIYSKERLVVVNDFQHLENYITFSLAKLIELILREKSCKYGLFYSN